MANNQNPQNPDNEINILLQHYRNLRSGNAHGFISEDDFEVIIDYYDSREQLPKALEAANFAIELYPYANSLLLRKADLLLCTGKYKSALRVLEQAELLDSTDINLYILKTDALLANDMPKEAIALLESVLTQFVGKEKIDLLFELADVYDDYDDYDKVFDCLKHILNMNGTNTEALYKICFWADHTKRNEESVVLHQKILDEHPYCELAWFNLGSAFQGLKLYEKAIDAYEYVIAIDEKFNFAYRNIGDACMRLRQWKKAIEYLQKVLTLSKPEEVIFEAIGYCYEKQKLPADARFYYKKALHHNPDNAALYYKIANTYMQQQQWANGVKLLETAIKLSPTTAMYHYNLALCVIQQQQYAIAITHIGNALKYKPKLLKTWDLLLHCLYLDSDWENGMLFTKKAQMVTDEKPIFLYYEILFMYLLGNIKQATTLLQYALQVYPKGLKYIISIHPALLQNQSFLDAVVTFKLS